MAHNEIEGDAHQVDHRTDAMLDPASLSASLSEFERLRLIFDGIDAGLGLLGPDFTILELNETAMLIDGRPRTEVIGQSHWTAYPGTESAPVGELYKRVMQSRTAGTITHRYEWPDGRTSWYETRAFPVDGGCMGIYYRDITELKLQANRLAESDERFQAALRAVSGVLWTNSAAGEMIGEQPRWAELTGQSYEEYQGFGWSAAVHPEDAQPTIDAWNKAVAEVSTFEFEHRVRRADGSWGLYAVRAVPVRDGDGAIREWVGVHRDISERRATESRLRHIAATIDAAFYVYQPDSGQMQFVSPGYERMWRQGFKEAIAAPHSYLGAVHPADRERVETVLKGLADQGSVTLEFRLHFGEGDEMVVRNQASLTVDPISGMRTIIAFATDVTDYRRSQDLLAANAKTFSEMVMSNPFGIYVVDADFKLLQASRGAQQVFAGIEPLRGRDFADILRIVWEEPFASEAIGQFRNTLETGESYFNPATVEKRANIDQVEAYDWRIERIVLPDGRFGVVCYFYDLSERTSYEAQLRQLVEDKELLAREIDHRVKNSLTIVGSLLAMQHTASASEETRSALSEARNRVIAVAKVHEQLHRSHAVGVVDFADYLGKLCRDLEYSLRSSGVALDFAADAVELAAEQAMNLAIITNELITNAYKHGHAAGARKVTVRLESQPDHLVLCVSDDGAGLPQSDPQRRTGLGMRLVATLSKQLGAELKMPEPGQKAVYRLVVPVVDPAKPDPDSRA